MEGMRDKKYSRLVGRVERLKIFMVRWNGMKDENYPSLDEETKDQKYSGLGGMDERDKIPKDRWKGWKIGETQG